MLITIQAQRTAGENMEDTYSPKNTANEKI